MSDPVLALILIPSFVLLLTMAAAFKNLDAGLWREARNPLIAGIVCGVIIAIVRFAPEYVVAGVMFTVAALYVRLTGSESEPADGMALGALTGAAAAIPLVVQGRGELLRLSECLLAAAVAGFGVTFGLAHVRDRMRQAAVDAVTAAAAVAAAWLPTFLTSGARATERDVAVATVVLIPLTVVATVFAQWPVIRKELHDEARLGVIDQEDVEATAHPLRRLGRAGWHDPAAHREFVRIAGKIALRKRLQRGRPEEVARLYQLEVIKLRMELQEMTRIDRLMRLQAEQEQPAR